MKFFEMLVIIGVLGELIADGGIFLFSSNLQTIAKTEIASVSNDSAKLGKQSSRIRDGSRQTRGYRCMAKPFKSTTIRD
jgi:hypothetical protein